MTSIDMESLLFASEQGCGILRAVGAGLLLSTLQELGQVKLHDVMKFTMAVGMMCATSSFELQDFFCSTHTLSSPKNARASANAVRPVF